MGFTINTDEKVSQDGRIIDSILSEHVCEGLLEGYLLTGRHGFFNSYEAPLKKVYKKILFYTINSFKQNISAH